MAYSTEDCKKYLVTIYTDTEEKGWKRIRKYNDDEKRVARDFEYKDGRKATILETPEGLKDKSLLNKLIEPIKSNPFAKIREKNSQNHSQLPQHKNINSDDQFKDFMNKVLGGDSAPKNNTQNKSSIDMMKDFLKEQEEAKKRPPQDFGDMFGLGNMPGIYIQAIQAIQDNNGPLEPLIRSKENIVTQLLKGIEFSDLDTNEEKFLYVLVNGTQWEEEDGNKASTDFFPSIQDKESFIKNLMDKNVDLYNMYLTHIINVANIIESMDENYIPFHTMEGEEALKDMCMILKDIINIYEQQGKKVEFDKDLVEGSIYTLESLKKLCSMNDAEELWEREDVEKEIDELISVIKSKSPKKGMKP